MKRSQQGTNSILSVLFAVAFALLLAGCGGGGGPAASGGGGSATATVSGKVTLSDTVTNAKPQFQQAAMMKAMLNAPKGKPGSKAYAASSRTTTASSPLRSAVLDKALNVAAFANGTVYLYNADHPEWLFPVAETTTASDCSYTLSVLKYAALNNSTV